MTTKQLYWEAIGVSVEIASFIPAGGEDRCEEFHVMLHVEPREDLFAGQMERINLAERMLKLQLELQDAQVVFRRYFVSDATNQMPVIQQILGQDTENVSVIQQPPLDGSKIAAWLYLQKGTVVSHKQGMTVAEHNGYLHLYKWGMCIPSGDSYQQTQALLENYESELRNYGATLADNCIRTWFFVRDVDTQYAGLVKARKENFLQEGLSEKTHYIASTGIGGLPANPKAIVQLGTYALTGFNPAQQRYLYAPTHLNPTYEYGVTFERGTVVEFGDRAEVYISGTASINNKGEVVHVGDIVQQTERMWENVETLLQEGNASFQDVAQIVVYLRDLCDYPMVKRMFDQKFPHTPRVITLAPVCRPAWLIEMECIAITPRQNQQYRPL